NDVTLKMPAFEWVHVQLHQQKGMISLSPPTICNSADFPALPRAEAETAAGTAYQAAERGWRQGGRYRATDGGRRVLGAAGAADDRP
ncbi:hypothetical protein L6M77_28525, partial [Klebsiella pneumoniae]|nr:hypothetical protein [Klebsiella pneumoniae]